MKRELVSAMLCGIMAFAITMLSIPHEDVSAYAAENDLKIQELLENVITKVL